MNKHPPEHFVVINDGNNSGHTEAICQAVPEQRPAGEASCLKMDTESEQVMSVLCLSALMQMRRQKGARRYHSGQESTRSTDSQQVVDRRAHDGADADVSLGHKHT